jgi:vacuolar-type H+-ATPase subunit H
VEKIQKSLKIENDASRYSLDEYRNKLEEIIRSENEKFRLLAEEEAKEITSEAWRKADEIISQSQKKAADNIGISEMKAAKIVGDSQIKADKIIEEYKQKALTERDKIIQQAQEETSSLIEKANQEAKQIIFKAEENAREEAKSRVKSEREKILSKARQESDSIIALAQQEATEIITSAKDKAEKEAQDTVERAKEEAEILIRDEIEKFRGETQAQATQIITQTEKKAQRLINEVMNDSKQLHTLIVNSVSKAENLIVKMKEDMQIEFGELTKRTAEKNNKLEEKIASFVSDNKSEIEEVSIKDLNLSNDIWLILKGGKSAAQIGDDEFVNGEIELKTLASFDKKRMNNFKKLFTQIPSVDCIGEYASEEGYKIHYQLKEPLPLLDILKNTPWIDRLVEDGNNLKLTIH